MRSDADGGVAPPRFYDLVIDDTIARASMHSSDHLSRRFGVQGNALLDPLSFEQDTQEDIYSSHPGGYDHLPQNTSFTNVEVGVACPIIGPENQDASPDRQISRNEDILRKKRKQKTEEVRMTREAEAHEKRIRKELEKQDALRRKREEQMRKEMEKHDRERRKEEKRLIREKQREEERLRREQGRELERREKLLQKEYIKAEKRRQKEELRREKEAAKRKAAIERATARKIARESMGLIEDEQLELMGFAASSKGLPSISSLDHSTIQNLELFRDSLSAFPPTSVKLKRPFAIEPWIDSDENIGNLLMVWRFLITFADVLQLWPFTLDEFVQALHDYDSRLLCEVHVALLKVVIKDIEDVARTTTGGGTNQNSIANPEGGHPSIVEGAYSWGFNIRNWQQHLSALTWPEILRQFALSAGFGPKLKNQSSEPAYLHDNTEGKGCEDIVSTLRNGSAAENAAAMMQEKGFCLSRRSRRRLTPGTVKFACFHVLSLEGSKGLTILELADKIQKSGLRDLKMSKAPEASIAAALSRDAKLFERIAPSTYCVRSPFRKDSADAESILSAAREKLQTLENVFLAGEDAEIFGRDEDSDCDVAELSEVEDLGTPLITIKNADHYDEVGTCSETGKGNFDFNDSVNLHNGFYAAGKDYSPSLLSCSRNADDTMIYHFATGEDTSASKPDSEGIEIDESKSYEPWVLGLTEGEYSDLSVDERLNALVALVSLVNEGNSVRTVLEERLEAANVLKKQMWAEVQLDKKRIKEENTTKLRHPSFMGSKAETKFSSSALEECQSPLLPVKKNGGAPLAAAATQESVIGPNSFPVERTLADQDFSMGPDNFSHQQCKYAAERSRSQLKSYIAQRAEELYVYRSLPLGQDRRHNRYWKFVASASRNDPGASRIFIESQDCHWRLIDSEEAFDALLMSLDTRGIREYHLHSKLQKIGASFKENARRNLQCTNALGYFETSAENEVSEMDLSPHCTHGFDSPGSMVCGLNPDTLESSLSFKIQLGKNETEKEAALKRYQDFQKWIWRECFNSLKVCAKKYGEERCTQLLKICDICQDSYDSEGNHCLSCHKTFGEFDENVNKFSEHAIQCREKRKLDAWNLHLSDSSLPLRSKLIKALLAFIEVSIPSVALQSFWEYHRKTWGMKLCNSSSTEDLLQALTLLEGAIKPDCLSSNFETTNELLNSCTLSGRAACDSAHPGPFTVLPWIPQTTAAVALRLMELDASISYEQDQKVETLEDMAVGDFMKLPSSYAVVKNTQKVEPAEMDEDKAMEEINCLVLGNKHQSSVCQRGDRGRGHGRAHNAGWHKRVTGSRSETGKPIAGDNENVDLCVRQLGRKTHGQVTGWGRRMIRRRRTENRNIKESPSPSGHMHHIFSPDRNEELPRYQDWGKGACEKIKMMQMEDASNSSSAEEMESNETAQAIGQKCESFRQGFDVASNGRTGHFMEVNEENVNSDNNGDGEDVAEKSDESVDMYEGSDGLGNESGSEDESTESAVSDSCSD
ncbi:homeobox-DDT domain protein RLT1-like isoform X3 [Malania oleifera]|nr:homeobox-DDT domain protein RLT1-like isoform X3 [Malania oleifera]